MQADPSLFTRWALPKLRPLLEARLKDARLGRVNSPHFTRLLNFYLLQLEEQSFAQPPASDADPSPSVAVMLTPRALRQRAVNFFRDHSNPQYHALINVYERAGNVSDESPLDGTTAVELWASTVPTLVRELTCVELGICPTTSISRLPRNFCVRRHFVIKREFAGLCAAEQDDWGALARERKRAFARGETNLIAVQDAQTSIPAWLSRTIFEKFSHEALGEMVVGWDGFFTGLHDNVVVRFHGQVATYSPCPLWYGSPSYVALVEPAWMTFIANEVDGTLIDRLRALPLDAGPELLPRYRQEMRVFLEDLFRLACRTPHLNRAVFWELVAARPEEFVASHRLPEGVAFCKPSHMPEDDFRAFYAHVKLSFDGSNTVDCASRFVYESDTINLYIGLSDARHLKARWDARRLEAADAAAVATAVADAPNLAAVDTPVVNLHDTMPFDADDAAVEGAGIEAAAVNGVAVVDLVPPSQGAEGVAMHIMSAGGGQ